mmetsp:Transcript_21465/g.64086  ORF Transcript_21465/g.64086 Transcript_21465/m.64086 type:complete len:233 (+) Transcript_21465:102-800(+)
MSSPTCIRGQCSPAKLASVGSPLTRASYHLRKASELYSPPHRMRFQASQWWKQLSTAAPCGPRTAPRISCRSRDARLPAAADPSRPCVGSMPMCQESTALCRRKTGVRTKGRATPTWRHRQEWPAARQSAGALTEAFACQKFHSNCGKPRRPCGTGSVHAGKTPLSERTATNNLSPATAATRSRMWSASRTEATPPALQPEMTSSVAEAMPCLCISASSTASKLSRPRKKTC